MMYKNNSTWQQLREALGFYQDERIKAVNLSTVRYSYVTAVAVLLPLGLYQQLINGHPGAFWVVLSAAAFSALFLGVQWLRMKRWERWDEMAAAVMDRNYYAAQLLFIIPFAIYFLLFLPFWAGGIGNLGRIGGFYLYNLALLIAIIPSILIHVRQRTYPPQVWLTSVALAVLIVYLFFVAVLFGILFWASINA